MVTDPPLRLRGLTLRDEAEFRAGHEAMQADDFVFGPRLEAAANWPDYLRRWEDFRLGRELPDGYVPDTFLVAEAGGVIVGRTSIRHRLNDFLRRDGGHIGYGVLPQYRRRGYATAILRQSLAEASRLGIDQALLVCDDDNIGSITVIERCGGRLDSAVPGTGGQPGRRRYWIATAAAG
jgi:predicted acetyltransferase